jgi:hypothetical protein
VPEAPAFALSRRAHTLWGEIATAYDEIERRLATAAWSDIGALATHIKDVEGDLRLLLEELARTRAGAGEPTAALKSVLGESEALVESLAARLPAMLRAATAARDAAAAQLARCHIGRSNAESYKDLLALSPRFTSRRI